MNFLNVILPFGICSYLFFMQLDILLAVEPYRTPYEEVGNFIPGEKDYSLSTNILATTQVANQVFCAVGCLKNPLCQSFNYENEASTSTHACELLDITKNDNPTVYVTRAGFTHYESIAVNNCSTKPCINNATCVQHGTTNYSCICLQGYFGKNCEEGSLQIIASAGLELSVLETILGTMEDVVRKLVIGIANQSGYKWRAVNVYFSSGLESGQLPDEVDTNMAALYRAKKSGGAYGVVGVLSFHLPSINKSLCVLFSVPYSYTLYSNWWDAKMYEGVRTADYDTYYELYYGSPIQGDGKSYDKDIGFNIKIENSVMSTSGHATLMITVK